MMVGRLQIDFLNEAVDEARAARILYARQSQVAAARLNKLQQHQIAGLLTYMARGDSGSIGFHTY